jgi:integrase
MLRILSPLKRRGLKNKTVKNIITDPRAMFNCAIEAREDGGPGLLDKNPGTKKVAKLIGNTRAVKKPINPKWFDIASATIENRCDRAWFDVMRYLGMRKDESNRLQWSDIDWRAGNVRIPRTKTEEAEAWLPVAPAALTTLRELYESEDATRIRLMYFQAGTHKPKEKRFTVGEESLSAFRE